ncbi:MAG: 3-dehydroquinate synthase [Phycisphaerae bacterium]
MPSLVVRTGTDSTEVTVRTDSLPEIGVHLQRRIGAATGLQVVVVTDETVGDAYGELVVRALGRAGFYPCIRRFAPGEASKDLATAGELYEFLSARHIGRDAVIVALGGGVVSDLAGFVAATWMRGVRFAICPTTMESAIDASIGGKTAINITGGKNLVGAFHQPILVLVDPTCLRTLSPRDVRAGLAESVKHALISSESFLEFHEDNAERILGLDGTVTGELITANIKIKAGIVEEDVHERGGRRMVLNLGHTIGHSIEACAGFALRHGECVGLGLLAACELSRDRVGLDGSVVERVRALLQGFSLPIRLEQAIDADQLLEAMLNDKKVRGGRARFVLLEAIGRPVIRDDVPEAEVRRVCESLLVPE